MIEELESELRLAETFGDVNIATPDNAVLCGMQPNSRGALAVDVPVESVGNKDVLHKYTFLPYLHALCSNSNHPLPTLQKRH